MEAEAVSAPANALSRSPQTDKYAVVGKFSLNRHSSRRSGYVFLAANLVFTLVFLMSSRTCAAVHGALCI